MRILFLHQHMASYVKKDLDILRSEFEVQECHFRGLKDVVHLWKGVRQCDIVFSWFGSIHAFFAVLFSKLLGKKSVVVAGGHDVAHEQDIKYGMFSFWWKRWCPLYVFSYVDLILTVSNSTTRECIENARAKKEKIKLLYHGFDSKVYKPMEGIEKESIVITIGGVDTDTLKRKGLELFVKSARFLPEIKFFLIGPWQDGTINYLKKIATANVAFTNRISDNDLVRICSKAKVYVQVSHHEAFGCSIAEAMLCECIPVVSRRAAIPEVVGDTGYYVESLDPKEVSEEIKKAISAPLSLGRKGRERIVKEFPLERRKSEIVQIIRELMEN